MQSESEEDDLLENLVYATSARDVRSVEKLIQAGIDPSTPTKANGCSALHTAAVLESPSGPEIVARMLHHGANPNIKTPTGLSPLHIAAMWGRYETINVLLNNGAEVAVKDEDDMSALDYAEEAEKNKEQCIDALTRYRSNTNRRSSGGRFMCKSRINLNKILGGHVEFSTCLSDSTLDGSKKEETNCKGSNEREDSFLTDITTNNIDDYDDKMLSLNVSLNETLFQTCNESISNIVTSTMLEGPESSDLLSEIGTEDENNVEQATISVGYLGDSSSSSKESNESAIQSADETFWSVRNSFMPSSDSEGKDDTLPPIRRRKNTSKFFVPLSPSPLSHIDSINHDDVLLEETPELIRTLNTPEKESTLEEEEEEQKEMIQHMSDLLHEEPSETISNGNVDMDLATEATINYSNDSSVSHLIEYFESGEQSFESLNPDETTLSESPTKSGRASHFVLINCREEVPKHQRRSLDELSSITVSYDWKDVSQLRATKELDETIVEVPTSILTLTNIELRDRLISLGEKPGPILESTKKVYQKHLARIETFGNDHKIKKDDKLKDYTSEMRQILLGVASLSKGKGEDFEQEMSFIFENPEKHTWREGTQKTSFNYILLDPRVTKNLADRGQTMSFMEQFRVFVDSIFYIGKGKKSRPYEHFHEAVKHMKNENKNLKTSTKVNMILDVWEQGYGVTTLHVFHSVIPVEAYTREACMIEAMSLSRLTNIKQGDFYGPVTSWGAKKKRLLGIHLLMKAMRMYLIEGERQIKQRDVTK